MSQSLMALYSSSKVMIDCKMVLIPCIWVIMILTYKRSYTLKDQYLSLHGTISFVSLLFTRSMLDAKITILYYLSDLLVDWDSIRADKSLKKFKVSMTQTSLTIPVHTQPFLLNHDIVQFKKEVEQTQITAKLIEYTFRNIYILQKNSIY